MERIKHVYKHHIMFPKGATVTVYKPYLLEDNTKKSYTFENDEDFFTEIIIDTPDYAEGKSRALVNISFKIADKLDAQIKDVCISKHSLVVLSIVRQTKKVTIKPKQTYEQLSLFE